MGHPVKNAFAVVPVVLLVVVVSVAYLRYFRCCCCCCQPFFKVKINKFMQSIQDLNANDDVMVYLRIKPIENVDVGSAGGYQNSNNSNNIANNTTTLHNQQQMTINTIKEPFTFDHILPPSTSQEEVWQMVMEPLVQNFLSGYNGTAFAYGQTGSGKTYTMQGRIDSSSPEDIGITPRTLQYIFAKLPQQEGEHQISCSFVEIYNENIVDLLSTSRNTPLCSLREHEGVVRLEGCCRPIITIAQQAMSFYLLGTQNRRTAETVMNRESSRSHSIFTIHLTTHLESSSSSGPLSTVVKTVRESRLNLIDLAGSERQTSTGTVGKRLKEAGNINRSLLALSLVITSLTTPPATAANTAVSSNQPSTTHVPYRDSKLTHLLKDSLGGNSKTVLIANLCPIPSCLGESISTLRFAQRVKMVKNSSVINEDNQYGTSYALVEDLKQEIKRLKDLLGGFNNFNNNGFDDGFGGDNADQSNNNNYNNNFNNNNNNNNKNNDNDNNNKDGDQIINIKDGRIPEAIERSFLVDLLDKYNASQSITVKLQQDLQELYSLSERRERQISSERMIIKFRDQTIQTLSKRLAVFAGGSGTFNNAVDNGIGDFSNTENNTDSSTNNDLNEIIKNYQSEISEIKRSISCNPEILRLTIENKHLRLKENICCERCNGFLSNSEAFLNESAVENGTNNDANNNIRILFKRLGEYERMNMELGLPHNIERRLSDLRMLEPAQKKGRDSLIKEKNDEIEELTQELEKSLQDHEEIGREMSLLREDLVLQKEQHCSLIMERDTKITLLQKEVSSLKEAFASVAFDKKKLSESLLEANSAVLGLKALLTEKEGEIALLKELLKAGEEEIERVRGEILVAIEPLEIRKEELELHVDRIEKEKDILEEELLKQRNENDRLCQHGNMKQKLQYHLQIKGENNQFREEIRLLRDELSRMTSIGNGTDH